MSVLDTDPGAGLLAFLDLCKRARVPDVQSLLVLSKLAIAQAKNENGADHGDALSALRDAWYASLRAGNPAWSVYGDRAYLAETWGCWIVYSRAYLRRVRSSLLSTLARANVNVIADLGCGCGHTTAALTELFPRARVYGTNLEDTQQIAIARMLGEQYGFSVVSALEQVPAPVDLVFASEYFEHHMYPLDHLENVLRTLRPRMLLIANSFGAHAIGHFDRYLVDRRPVNGSSMGRLFNQRMRARGYVQQDTGFWNGRPMFWSRK